jgi:nickel transport protein
MAEASVTVYSTSNPAESWLTGSTDSLGRFSFDADRDLSEEWDVSVRMAGHGDMVRIDLSGGAGGTTAFSTAQILLMALCVVWGFIGTALFFISRRRGGEG